MCKIENNYIPPGPDRYAQLAKYINSTINLEYISNQNLASTTQGILEGIEVFNNAEYLKLDNLSVRIDKVISVSKA
jgi:aminopeptidase-like protein